MLHLLLLRPANLHPPSVVPLLCTILPAEAKARLLLPPFVPLRFSCDACPVSPRELYTPSSCNSRNFARATRILSFSQQNVSSLSCVQIRSRGMSLPSWPSLPSGIQGFFKQQLKKNQKKKKPSNNNCLNCIFKSAPGSDLNKLEYRIVLTH